MDNDVQVELRKFVAPEFVFGVGARFQVGLYAKNFGGRKILIVTDPGIERAGWTQEVVHSLEENSLSYAIFDGVTPNPKDFEVMNGVEKYRIEGCDIIVAVGGGSPIDCAKGIAVVAANDGHILDFEGVDTIPNPGPPLICIPSTSGSAADVSQFAIISDRARSTKIAIISKTVVPDVALIDPAITTTMDPYLTACTGIDTMVHGIEAFVSNANSLITDLHALKAIELVKLNLERAVRNPADMDARINLSLGCLEAGLAFSNASLGAVHSMAHSLGGYLDLPHGECNAVVLSHVILFNYEASPERYERIAQVFGLDLRGMTPKEKGRALFQEIERMRSLVGVGKTLGQMGVRNSDVGQLAEHAVADPCLVTNPRRVSRRDLEVVYEEAL